jgi:hypothetical protein
MEEWHASDGVKVVFRAFVNAAMNLPFNRSRAAEYLLTFQGRH